MRHPHDPWHETEMPQLTAACPEAHEAWRDHAHITPPCPAFTLRVQLDDGSPTELSGVRVRPEGCDCAQIILLQQ